MCFLSVIRFFFIVVFCSQDVPYFLEMEVRETGNEMRFTKVGGGNN